MPSLRFRGTLESGPMEYSGPASYCRYLTRTPRCFSIDLNTVPCNCLGASCFIGSHSISAVLSASDRTRSPQTAQDIRYNHPFRCRCGGNGILGNKVLVAPFDFWDGEAWTGRATGSTGDGGTAASRRKAALRSRSCRSSAGFR
jgi:hypothetical protein